MGRRSGGATRNDRPHRLPRHRADQRPGGGRTMTGRITHALRSGATGFLVVLTALAFLATALGFWLNRNTLETDVWVDRVGPLASEPEVQSALTDFTTAQV